MVGRKCCHRELAGGIFEKTLKKRAAHRIFVRGRLFECVSVAELLSEHCLAGKCSTSHFGGPGNL